MKILNCLGAEAAKKIWPKFWSGLIPVELIVEIDYYKKIMVTLCCEADLVSFEDLFISDWVR